MRLLLLLATAAVEAVPLTLLVALVDAWDPLAPADPLSPAAPFGAILLGAALAHQLSRYGVGERAGRAAMVLAALAVAVPLALGPRALSPATLRPDAIAASFVTGLAALLYAWSRGAALAREGLAHDPFGAVYASFRRGLIALFTALALAALGGGRAAREIVGRGWGPVIVFFLVGLCALALARVEGERPRGDGSEGATPTLHAQWLTTLLGVIAGVLLAGALVAAFASPALFAGTLAGLGHAGDLLALVLTPVIALLAMLVDPLVALLRLLIGRGRRPPAPRPVAPGAHRPGPPAYNQYANPYTEHGLLVLALFVAAALALWYAFAARRRGGAREGDGEWRESLWSWALAGAALRALLRRLWARLRPVRGATVLAGGRGVVVAAGAPSDGSIRALYRRLLARAAELGLPRRGSETPHEYLDRLRGLPGVAPPRDGDAALLTAAYARARYGDEGGEGESPADARAARAAWERLERALDDPQPPPSDAGV